METPPRARGAGRSGPRRRTGCLTCRARKVRCDEAKPVCANCTRLRLQCAYKNIIPGNVSRRSHPPRASPSTTTSSTPSTTPSFPSDPATHPAAPGRPDPNFFDTVLRPDEQRRQRLSHLSQTPRVQESPLPAASPVPGTGPSAVDFANFDMLGFIGEITSDFEQKHLDLTNGMSDFPAVTSGPMSSPISHGVPVGIGLPESQIWTTAGTPSVAEVSLASEGPNEGVGADSAATEPPPVNGGIWPETRASYEEQLVTQFLESAAPPTIFGPVDLEWPFVRDIIVAQSQDCNALRNSLYCYADLQHAKAEGKRWNLAPTYHQHASAEIQTCLLGEVSEPVLKHMFTAVFLLMLSELISPPEMWRPGTSFLHSAFLLLQRFHRRTRSWTGFSHLIISWVSLLDVKALIAGRDGDPLIDLGSLTPGTAPTTSPPSQPESKADNTTTTTTTNADSDDVLLSKPAYLIHDAIVGPAYRFFAQAQQVIRRIVCIDLHHRSRGTVSDEFEVLQIAHQVGADLESLWNSRPRVLDVYDRPQDLCDTLRPAVAAEVCRTFRQYLANFLAIFIYLHRVAFAIYPRTDRVHRAVDQIIQLATVESTSRRGYHSSSSSSASTTTAHLPVSFIWPLFVAGLEGSLEQRAWIVLEMQRMATNGPAGRDVGPGTLRHPNANKALLLLEEMTRRQDTSRTWADSRCVRRELFTDFFVMI